MMVLAPISLSNGWFRSKICIHAMVSISESILWGVMQTLLICDLDIQNYPLTPVLVILTVWTFAMPESTFAPWSIRNQVITHDTDTILKFWFQILNLHQKPVLVIYNMLHVDKVSLMPFLEILTIIAIARDTDQILIIPLWGCKLYCILHPIIYIYLKFNQVILPSPADHHWNMFIH